MPFLSEADQDQLKTIFTEQLDRHVRLRAFTKPTSKLCIPGRQLCASCREAEPFVRELATLSDKLEVVVHDVQAEPALADEYRVDGLLPVIQLEPVAPVDDSTPSQRFNVMGVPKTVINGVQELIGAQPEARLMAALRAAPGRPDTT